MKIKANDDRILGTAAALLLLYRARLARGDVGGLVTGSLEELRADPDAFKAAYPKRDLAAARDPEALATLVRSASRRELHQQLIAAVDVVLARIQRNKIQFSSLVEMDNYFVANLRRFD
jgi:hypothetical protein